MSSNDVMGLISTIALSVPVFCILFSKLGRYRTFPDLLIYYASALIYNCFTQNYIPVSPVLEKNWGLVNNLTDIPLMIYFMSYFSTTRRFANQLRYLIYLFVAFELCVLIICGFTVNTTTIVLGPGLVIILSLSIHFFIRQVKMAVIHRKATGKALIVTSVLFMYGCFSFIYLMYYVFKAQLDASGKVKQQVLDDTFLIFFLVTIFSAMMMGLGILIERRRVQKLNELKVTRRELSAIYSDTRKAAPLRTAMLDFDKDQWN